MRPTVRLRLTAWYASIFLLGGAVLLAISYVIVSRNTSNLPIRVTQKLAAAGAVTGGVIGLTSGPLGAALGAVGGALVGIAAERMMHGEDDAEDLDG